MVKSVTKNKSRPAIKPVDLKGKRPKSSGMNRQETSKTADGSDEKVGFSVISVKLRPAEKAEFKALCKTLGVSTNWAMRSMARQSSGFLELQKKTLEELQNVSRQLSGVATNINQIAKAGNRTLSPDYRAFMEDRRELGKELSRLQAQLQTILDVGKRRTDGLEMLEKIANRS